ncbi:zinc finger CCCH domain-containing protein 65-like isoform X2 [Malania oleifera]|uniref:zinc finger CCCH domain-containing protein 65-like isoform X2 n=1 Tax=Malania oleifera TaxID=397392 RepID=UPI0025ADCF80|nr:zinc finger CCCH domain-containing protein 65-like isoform X2 [Malania oleifera]
MESSEESEALRPQEQGKKTELGFIASSAEEALAQEFQNVGLNDEDAGKYEAAIEGAADDRRYPLRPYAEDCPYYLRTGTCKFGLNCRFNHPVRRVNQYYLTAGGCKFGKACRYNHSQENTELGECNLNFLGLPMRPGERECPFYMRNGSCGYGANCRFHHPDPSAVDGSNPGNTTPSGSFVGSFDSSLGYRNGESVPLHVLVASQPAVVPSSLHTKLDKPVPYFENNSSFMPTMQSLPQGAHPSREWNDFQVPLYPHEIIGHHHSAPAVSNMKKEHVFMDYHQDMHVDEFPERPGEPECAYFMKTGYCKYKSACRYHHPKDRASNFPAGHVGDRGLPLRPGRKICWHYEKNGVCRYGHSCMFDHPVNYGLSAGPSGSLEPLPGSNSAAFGGMGMAGSGNGGVVLTQQYA